MIREGRLILREVEWHASTEEEMPYYGTRSGSAFRKRFRIDVLRSLELSFGLITDEARALDQERLRFMPDAYISDLKARIAALYAEL